MHLRYETILKYFIVAVQIGIRLPWTAQTGKMENSLNLCHRNALQITSVCVCVQERDTLRASYKASGSCYGHILITRSVLDYVLWACNITPSGRSPSGFSVSWLLAEKKHIRGLAKTLLSVLQHL